MGWGVSVAVTIFGWAINPEYVSGPNGFFNLPAVYDMWKFVRDFLNLFFILALLFAAFATIFQIDKYSYKKILLKLVIAALMVNFSFPISRALIDVTNVPMYFFANSLIADTNNPSAAFGSALSASKLENILVPPAAQDDLDKIDTSRLLAAIVFMFLFAVTLLVLAVQFIIRLIALIILVILSPIGFVMPAVPGLQKYGGQWWDNFLKYAFFGPAAMFMLVLATHFFDAIGGANSGTYKNFQAASQTSAAVNSDFIASMAMFSIPIVMLWFTIGISGKFAIAGASASTAWGYKAGNWGKRKLYDNRIGRGLYRGGKKAVSEGKIAGFDYGNKRLGKYLSGNYWKQPSKIEAGIAGGVYGGKAGARQEIDNERHKAVLKRAKEIKESNESNETNRIGLKSSSLVERQARARALAEAGAIKTPELLLQALEANKDNQGIVDKELHEFVQDKAHSDAWDGVSDRYKKDPEFKQKYDAMVENPSMYLRDEKTGKYVDHNGKEVDAEKRVASSALEGFYSKIKKEGELQVRVDYDAQQFMKAGKSESEAKSLAYEKHIAKLSADDLAKQGSILSVLKKMDDKGEPNKNYDPELVDYFKGKTKDDPQYYQEALKKMKKGSREIWRQAIDGVQKEQKEGLKEGSREWAEAEWKKKQGA
ncbi:MAG: hypothetical protein A2808_01975 [Candidatus Moranbacteria bacterium RIFCSPHIGHO2_01_FULL_55_24]|nr:MAG: hypothetical protein A2808_01975 [Candidatus Moranbacteria bacterium RIFCSPHIGHO2_01_FULL_55_24]